MPVEVPELADTCVVVNGVAKTYAMTGWRVGWLIGPRDVVAAATNLQSHATSNVANVSQVAFDHLDAPVVIVGSRNHVTPAPELESLYFPQPEWIIDAIHERILPLPGHVPSSNQTEGELLRRARLGV